MDSGSQSILKGEVEKLSAEQAKECFKLAPDYEVDEKGLLFFYRDADQPDIERDKSARLVVPTTLQTDIPHHYHVSLEEDQGTGQTYHKIKAHFHWRGLYRSVQAYVEVVRIVKQGRAGRPLEGSHLEIYRPPTLSKSFRWTIFHPCLNLVMDTRSC